ncbi:MAG: dephospho-CoA kinase [Aquificaceae bacterium]|nr:dephospho-CoA kinase [Aquificaceae bacterium]MCS7195708.1 dephospho-CoA kinase [Aquificaceae bacterium]MDW8032470.1 dephospho-CoA kinase [Aquificaceae bacterium]MDW8294258.1 dephospho-CoA kinase [Aquificaceae bacterium]
MKDWQKYTERIERLKSSLEDALGGLDVEYELKTPGDVGFDPSFKVPYVLLKYYTDEEHAHERKIELFEYYLEAPVEETTKLIKDMVEEFLMEIDQSQYGGG